MNIEKVSIIDIAKISGFSTTTVSRVLNGKAKQYRISLNTQQNIEEVAKEMHYIPNHFAANLRTGKSKTIALIVPTLSNPFFANIASEISAEVRKYGYITMISDSDESIDIEILELEQLRARNIEGLIIAPSGNQSWHVESLYDSNIPVVCVDRYFENLDISYVLTDNYMGANIATKRLIDNGHKFISCIQGVETSTPNRLRVQGFIDTMENAGLKGYTITGEDFTVQNGYLETKLLLQQKKPLTAIFTLSNTIALGCMKALKEEYMQIPENISLITFDDHPYLDYLSTPLTCIAQPVSDICKIAVKFLFSSLDKREKNTRQILLKPEIQIKESVRNIRYDI